MGIQPTEKAVPHKSVPGPSQSQAGSGQEPGSRVPESDEVWRYRHAFQNEWWRVAVRGHIDAVTCVRQDRRWFGDSVEG